MPKAVEEMEQASGTQLLDRAVAVLKFVGETAGAAGTTISEISDGLNLKQPTAHRIAVALERHGLIDRDTLTKRYRLGLGLFVLGVHAADESGLRTLAQPALTRIGAATGDTVFLMARSGVNAICVDRHQGSYTIDSLTGGIGGQIPLGVGSASLAILASLPSEEADAIIEANSPLYPQHHGLTAGRVRSLLPAVRQEGYALDRGDLVAGISAFAVAICPKGRPSGVAIAVNMTSARLSPERFEQLLPLVRREVQLLEMQINPLEITFRQRPSR
ncbi:IclR family transcriptional regulator [Mesorhizobium retamae]|uniref:IclR family transcriptional regulator n=1 Tax=Mesorhizobium retamae TaxID=2912854 RepID=A0ABS9QM44_9HYPH|nr:IclR family transcriptional regulator [Mesorhizobium sp. IRAMC:0171]MCG7508497.1 IclR family transcriptional regulator [Mesorhizobium sp. IRAMC:0171]